MMITDEIGTYEDLVNDLARKKDTSDIPMSTESHLYTCRKEILFASKDKVRIFTHDFYKNYHEFFCELSQRETEVITTQTPERELKHENLEYLLQSPNFRMFALDFDKIKGGLQSRNRLPSFMIVEPHGVYWAESPEYQEAAKWVTGITNFRDYQRAIDYTQIFEKLKVASNQIVLEGARC